LPTFISGGVAAPLLGPTGLAVIQVSHFIHEKETDLGLGAEYGVGPVSFRLGYVFLFNPNENLALNDQSTAGKLLSGIEGGVGLHVGLVTVDYAISQQAVDFGTTQRISLTLQFGGKGRWENARVEEKPVRKEPLPDWRSEPNRNDWFLVPVN
jgi:hypothetical protein